MPNAKWKKRAIWLIVIGLPTTVGIFLTPRYAGIGNRATGGGPHIDSFKRFSSKRNLRMSGALGQSPGSPPGYIKIDDTDLALGVDSPESGAVGTFSGLILDDRMAPVGDARIDIYEGTLQSALAARQRVPCLSDTSNAKGEYLFNIGRNMVANVTVHKPGYSTKQLDITFFFNSAARRTFILGEALGHIEGRVVDFNGRPVAGALVGAGSESRITNKDQSIYGLRATTTDSYGRYRIDDIARGNVLISCMTERYPFQRIDVDELNENQAAFIEIRLDRGIGLAVNVRNRNGRPIEGADVNGFKSDRDGKASVFQDENETVVDAIVRADGYRNKRMRLDCGKKREYEVVLEEAGSLVGRVHDESGEALEAAYIEEERTGSSAFSDRRGEFHIDLRSPVRSLIRCTKGGFADKEITIDENDYKGRVLDVVMGKYKVECGAIGLVVDGSGKPIRQFDVYFSKTRDYGFCEKRSIDDEDGVFQMYDLKPGIYNVAVIRAYGLHAIKEIRDVEIRRGYIYGYIVFVLDE